MYNFDTIPEVGTVEELRGWLIGEFKALSQSLNEVTELELRPSKHQPDRPRDGMIVHADGTSWNPGSGAGTYRRQAGVWVKVPNPTDIPVVTKNIRLIGDTNATLVATDQIVFTNATLTTTRTWTLPAASAALPHQDILIFDRKLAVGLTNNLIIACAGSDTMDDVIASIVFPGVGLGLRLVSDGVSKWSAYWTAVNVNSLLENVSSTRGALLERGSGGWTAITPGTSGNVLTSNGAGADPSYQAVPAAGGITLISTTNFPAAATLTLTGLGGYKWLWFVIINASQTSGTSRTFQAELSGNAGSTFGAVKQPFTNVSVVSGNQMLGHFLVTRTDQANNQVIFQPTLITNSAGAGSQIDSGSIGPINAIRFSWAGAATNFTGGSVEVYGLK